jgi:hypothetical protein
LEASIIQKYKGKTIPSLLKLATKHFNAYIRKRDSKETHFVCISCNKPKTLSQMHAGHYYSAGYHSSVRFDEDNVHGQCVHCNTFLHGNLINYKNNLLRKIGSDRMEELNIKVGFEKRSVFKWDRFSLIEIIEKYKKL